MYKTIYDIEIDFELYFTSIFKTEKYEKIFVFMFNQNELFDSLLTILQIDGVVLQIYGIWYWLIKKDITTAKEYFLKAIKEGNLNAYLSLSNIALTKEEKLDYLNIAHKNNVECSSGNLGIYYMNEKSDDLALRYLLDAVEKGEANAMGNLGVYYFQHNDEVNAIKYLIMAGENGFKFAYLNLMFYYAAKQNKKQCAKYYFYISIYLPAYMVKHYKKLDPKDYKINTILAEYEIFKTKMYFLNTNILIGDLIGKVKLEEFAEKFSNGENIRELLLYDDKQIQFEFKQKS